MAKRMYFEGRLGIHDVLVMVCRHLGSLSWVSVLSSSLPPLLLRKSRDSVLPSSL